MELSLDDFNALSAERSRREVRIAQLEMELQRQRESRQREAAELGAKCEVLRGQVAELQRQNAELGQDFENMRFENRRIKAYIMLSVERVRDFFSHMRDFGALSTIKTFVLDMLPANATPEQIAYTRDVMQLPLTEELPRVVNVSGNYTDVHDNGQVGLSEQEGGEHGW